MSKLMHKQGLAILSLVLLPLVWLWPSVFGSRTFVSYDINQFAPASILASDSELAQAREGANFDVTEVPVWFVPELELASRELREGRLPTWNPNARGGAPLHAHGLIGLCYPPNWLALFADEPASRLSWVAWCNLALAGLLAFGLLRQLGFGLPAAWFGAALFELSGPDRIVIDLKNTQSPPTASSGCDSRASSGCPECSGRCCASRKRIVSVP